MIIEKNGLSLTEKEWNNVRLVSHSLPNSLVGEAHVHSDGIYILSLLCLFEGLFDAGNKLLDAKAFDHAIESFEKARNLIPWPTVGYLLGMAHSFSGNPEVGDTLRNDALEQFEMRIIILFDALPPSTSDRNTFIKMIAERLDARDSSWAPLLRR